MRSPRFRGHDYGQSMTAHEKWQSRRVYHETFSKPGTAFPSWRGVPNRCKCGCDEVWYDRLSPTNWWTSFNLVHYASIVWKLVCVFLALQKALWNLPSVVWIGFRMLRAGYKREVLARIPPGASTSVAIATARLLVYGIIAPLAVIVWATMWTISRPGVIIIVALFFVTLGLILAVLSIPLIVSVVAISMSGLVFIIGGVGSILFLDNPTVGITAIVIGVCVQYELNRREGRRREELLGHLILMLQPQTRKDP